MIKDKEEAILKNCLFRYVILDVCFKITVENRYIYISSFPQNSDEMFDIKVLAVHKRKFYDRKKRINMKKRNIDAA